MKKVISAIYNSKEIKRKQHLIKILHLKSFNILKYKPRGFGIYHMEYEIDELEYKRLQKYIKKNNILDSDTKFSMNLLLEVLKGLGISKAGVDYYPANDRIHIPIVCETLRDLLIEYFESHDIFKGCYYFKDKTKKELIVMINLDKYIF
jgi:hypothetical protein